ncbi:MAG: ROK family protein [Acidimicrobiales bacterium]|jgi:glucokinase|nr:ROK family protein [Acidimicrobiales bacterium]HJM37600.1 ROK family protein [Acidimicrobiales bacterium]
MNEDVIGIDIGGTSARAIVLDPSSFKIKKQLTVTSSDNGRELVHIIKSLVEELEKSTNQSFPTLGLGIAGLAHRSGIVKYSPNLPNLIEFPITTEIENELGIPVVIGNDATVGTIAEWKIGAGKGSDNFTLVTLGTGIGTGFVIDGRLILGNNGFAGEAGHMTIDVNGPVHITGQRGPWEYFASGNALNRIVQQEASKGTYPWGVNEAGNWKNVTSKHLASGIKDLELDSLRILDHFCHEVSKGLINLVLLLDLERIVLGGGVSEIGEPLRSGVEKWIERTLIGSDHRPKIEVKLAELGSNAGAIGAALSTTDLL